MTKYQIKSHARLAGLHRGSEYWGNEVDSGTIAALNVRRTLRAARPERDTASSLMIFACAAFALVMGLIGAAIVAG